MRKESPRRHVCPWWMGFLLISPLRAWLQNPDRIAEAYAEPGMTVLDLGPGMGFLSLPLARRVGEGGRVICVDFQARMIESLRRRAAKAGLLGRLDLRTCDETGLCLEDLAGRVDAAFALYVVHEVPDAARFLSEIRNVLKPGGRLLLMEPRFEVSPEDFRDILKTARECGLTELDRPGVRGGHCRTLERAA